MKFGVLSVQLGLRKANGDGNVETSAVFCMNALKAKLREVVCAAALANCLKLKHFCNVCYFNFVEYTVCFSF